MLPSRFNVRRNVLAAFLAFVVNVALVAVSYRLLAKVGGVELIGIWSTLFAWASVVRFGDIGMASATLRFISLHDARHEPDIIGGYLDTGVLVNTAIFAVASGSLYLGFERYLPAILGEPAATIARSAVLPLCISIFLSNVAGALTGALQGLHKGYVSSILVTASNVLQLIAAIILIPRLGVGGLAWAQVLQYSLLILMVWLAICLEIGPRLPNRFRMAHLKTMVLFSLRAQSASLLAGFLEPVSKIMIGRFAGLVTLGIYEVAFKSLWLWRTAVVASVTAMVPSMTSLLAEQRDTVTRLYQRSTILVTSLVAAGCVVIVLMSPVIAAVLIGQASDAYTRFLIILSVGIVISAYGSPAYNLGFVTGALAANIRATAEALVVAVVLCLAVGNRLPPEYLVASVAVALAWTPLRVKARNERTLRGSS